MRCHPLRAIAHMSAQSRGTSQPLTLSSTHSPTLLISLILSLSRMKSKKEKARTRVRKWKGWRRGDRSSLPRATRSAMDQDQGLQPLHIPWLAQGTISSHYLEINPQTLTQLSPFAWMDHEDSFVGSNPRVGSPTLMTRNSARAQAKVPCPIFLYR